MAAETATVTSLEPTSTGVAAGEGIPVPGQEGQVFDITAGNTLNQTTGPTSTDPSNQPEANNVVPIAVESGNQTEPTGSEEQDAEEQKRIAHLHEIGATVESKDTYPGGYTIPGTDEWIPGHKDTKHTLVIPDAVSGVVSSSEVDADFAEKFNKYGAEQALQPDQQPEVAAEQVSQVNNENEPKLDKDSIADLVDLDAKGHGHISDSVKSEVTLPRYPEGHPKEGQLMPGRSGKFISNEEMEQIAANQDLIRDSLPNRDGTSEQPNPPETNIPPNEGGNETNTGNEGGEQQDGTDEALSIAQELAPEIVAFKEAEEAYDGAVKQYAHAKIRTERLFAGKDAKELFQTSGDQLSAAHAKLIEANAGIIDAQDQNVNRLEQENQQELVEATNQLDELIKRKMQAQAEGNYDDSLEEEISKILQSVTDHQIYSNLFAEHHNSRQAEKDAFNLEEATKLQIKVDEAMLEERSKSHPKKLRKIGDWIKRHPGARIAVGLALTGAGIVGAATFNAPLVSLAVAGGAALRGYGSYNFARGIGDRIANRRMSKADIQTVEDYLTVSGRESATRRRSKIAGSAVATALIAAPLVGRMLDLFQHPEVASTSPKPPTLPFSSGAATATPSAVPYTPIPVDGNMYPWTYGHDVLGVNIADPANIQKLLYNNLGVKVTGNGLGNGLGSFYITDAAGQVFRDPAHLNGFVQSVLGNGR